MVSSSATTCSRGWEILQHSSARAFPGRTGAQGRLVTLQHQCYGSCIPCPDPHGCSPAGLTHAVRPSFRAALGRMLAPQPVDLCAGAADQSACRIQACSAGQRCAGPDRWRLLRGTGAKTSRVKGEARVQDQYGCRGLGLTKLRSLWLPQLCEWPTLFGCHAAQSWVAAALQQSDVRSCISLYALPTNHW